MTTTAETHTFVPTQRDPAGPPGLSAAEQRDLQRSVSGLRFTSPEMSADQVLSRAQRWTLAVILGLLALGLTLNWMLCLQVLIGILTLFYALALIYRLTLVKRGLGGAHLIVVSDEEALGIPDADLPVYTVLIPAYNEPEVIGKLISAMTSVVYPADKLDIRLMLEADDYATIAAARTSIGAGPISIVLVPPAEPRTKPKACNYGLQTASGEFVTIFDAEDQPEPLQLRRAVVAMRRLGPSYACVQAQLGYFNSRQNLLTRWFAIEYANWFGLLLPGLVSVGAPIPLGGTSNHFRTQLLRDLGAWDPFNVTEDADLGIRLARLGYRVGVLDSVTDEEANSDFVNWIKQRSRWYKGYLQTWLVHMRRPARIHRELGWRGALGFHLFVFGTPITALANPAFWALTIVWYTRHSAWVSQLFPGAVFYIALTCFVIGNAAVIYVNMLTTRTMERPDLIWAALCVPLYWVMMSIAATKAAYQLIFAPSYWEKTAHGLGHASDPAAQS